MNFEERETFRGKEKRTRDSPCILKSKAGRKDWSKAQKNVIFFPTKATD